MDTSDEQQSWCVAGEPDSVEARFGLRGCGPAPAGNRCTFVAPAWTYDPAGRVRVGALMVVADHILGELSYRRRATGNWSLTTELTLDMLATTDRCSTLDASATEITAEPGANFARCELTDSSNRVVAVGTTRTVSVPGTETNPDVRPKVHTPEHLPESTIEDVLGLTYPLGGHGGEVCLTEPGQWANAFGIMHGGVAACVGELAASRLFSEHNPRLSTAQMHTCFLRPAPLGTPYVATARAYHIGRGFAVAEVLGHSGDRLCTVSTVTARYAGPET